jgi:hypothetical protein
LIIYTQKNYREWLKERFSLTKAANTVKILTGRLVGKQFLEIDEFKLRPEDPDLSGGRNIG